LRRYREKVPKIKGEGLEDTGRRFKRYREKA